MENCEATYLAVNEAKKLLDETVELAVSLIRQPSEAHPPFGNEGPVQRVLERFFRMNKYDVIDVFYPDDVDGVKDHTGWWPEQSYEDRPNVVAITKGAGGGKDLILNGHVDVVPAGDPKSWSFPPYGGVVCNDRIYGRGACDMKAGLAGMIMANEAVKRAGIRLAGDVIIQSVVAEETGVFNGTLSCCVKGYKADGAIIAEPTQLTINPGMKGNQVYEMVVPGVATHNCLWWRGASAIDNAIYMKRGLSKFQEIRNEELRNHELYNDKDYYPVPALVDNVWFFKAGQTNLFSVPSEASMVFMIEILPGEVREQVMDRFEKFVEEWASRHSGLGEKKVVLNKPDYRPIYPVSIPLSHPLVTDLSASIERVRSERPIVRGFESACDAMILMKYGNIPTVIYGPGDLSLAHRPNEYIEISELAQYVCELAAFIVGYCGLA